MEFILFLITTFLIPYILFHYLFFYIINYKYNCVQSLIGEKFFDFYPINDYYLHLSVHLKIKNERNFYENTGNH